MACTTSSVARVEGVGRAELFSPRQAVVGQVNGDDGGRRLQAGVGDDAQADGAAARHDDHVPELDAAAPDGVHGAGQRLDQGGVLDFEFVVGRLWLIAPVGNFMYSAQPPGVRRRKP